MTDAPKTNYTGPKKVGEEKAKKPDIKPIEGVKAIEKKKGIGGRIKESFTGDDAQSVMQYVLFEVVVPQTKTIISDVITQAVERALFGDARPRSSSFRSGMASRTDYNRISTTTRPADPREPRTRERKPSNDFGEIIVEDRATAHEVLERLGDIISQYDVVSVVDLYELVNISGSFIDNKWGWTDIRDASVRRVNGGFLIDLPRPVPID